MDSLDQVTAEVVACDACPRLVAWREQVAVEKRASFRDETYWGRPVPGFGDPAARVLVVGLAPAAHGGNRTGRVFTGDRSGDWVFRALWKAGFANQPTSVDADDGLQLTGAYVAAVVRCAPPANKPTPTERDQCLGYLRRELALLDRVEVIVVLGQFALDGVSRLYRLRPRPEVRPSGRARPPRRADAAVLVPPEPTEHLHRRPHRARLRRRLHPGPGPDRLI